MKKLIRNRLSAKCTALLLIMAMLFSVTCVFPSYSEGEATSRSLVSSTSLADGVYVLNNRLTGKFLANPGYSSFGMLSGKINSIRYDVQFSIRYVAGGCYDIRLTSNSMYLTRSSTLSNKNVTLQSLANSNYSFWTIEALTYNGYTYHYFKNAQTNEYLTWQNGALQVVSTIGHEGSETFYACSWRVAKYADYIEPTSISINDMVLPYSSTKAPVVNANPTNADLCSSHDFSYVCDETSYVSLDPLEGKFRIYNNTAHYKTTVTATHKPTGLTTTFSITTDVKGTFIGVTAESNHNHVSCLETASISIGNAGHSAPTVISGAFTKSMVDGYLDLNENGIFISRSHAGITGTESNPLGTFLLLNADSNNKIRYRSTEMQTSLNLSNMRIVVFVGCKTGFGGSSGLNLPSVAVARGAKVAIGFENDINCALANEWTEMFVEYLAQGYTVQSAIDAINDYDPNEYDSIPEHPYAVLCPMFCGDGTVTLN